MAKPLQSSGTKRFLDGYFDDIRLAGPNHLAPPSVNIDITKSGEAVYSKGYISVSYDLNNAGNASRPFHVPRHNVTFFAINGSVLFVNHNNSDAVVDTGITLTDTNGRNTRFAEYLGDIYLTNRTDGLRQIHMGKVNQSNATAGDATITVDQDLAGRLLAFGDDTSTLRIATTSPFTEAVTSTAATGVISLTGTLNSNVPDDTIVYTVEDISSGRPLASGITFWKERMILYGVAYDTAADSATNTVYMSSFATLSAIENVIDFNVANTAAKEMVGKGGPVTNVLSTRDYLYVFTTGETYFAGVSDVNTSTGGTPLQLLSNKYGCVNEDCSADLGNGDCAFMTNNNRIIGIKIATQSGAPVVFPDESFDLPISNTVALLDTDQSDSFFYSSASEKRLYIHCNVDSERLVLKRNTEIQKWEPPRNGWSMGGMFTKNGVLFATELTDDDVWQLGEGYQNNGQDYEKIAAISLVESEDGRTTLKLQNVGVSGRASELATVTIENYIGEGSPQQKSFTGPVGASSGSLGSVVLGSTTLGSGMGTELGSYDKLFGIYPTFGASYQLVVRSVGAFTVTSYTISGSALKRQLLTLE